MRSMETHAAPMAEVRADGRTTRYRCAGSGEPVVLLCDASDPRHGPLLDLLTRGRRVIAPVSDGSDEIAFTDVDRLARFLDGLGLESVPVIGVGRCAGPAAALARTHPARVAKMVLLGERLGDPMRDAERALAAL